MQFHRIIFYCDTIIQGASLTTHIEFGLITVHGLGLLGFRGLPKPSFVKVLGVPEHHELSGSECFHIDD